MAFHPAPAARPAGHGWWLLGLGIAALVGVLVGALIPIVAGHNAHRFRAGDCVLVAPTAGGELRTTRTGCDTDPSFTVAKLAGRDGDCAHDGYDRFRPPAADAATGKLCLVPNLVVGHCYRFGATLGVWDLSDCADRATVMRVADRLDTDNPGACTADLPARTYPSPPRTYCLSADSR